MIVVTAVITISLPPVTIETKGAASIGYNGFLFPHEYSGDLHLCTQAEEENLHLSTHAEKETRYIQIRVASFVSIVMYLTCIIIMLKFIK